MAFDTDILILGGGCAGLSLAVALTQRAPHLAVRILEARGSYKRDRTWCFWNTEPHPFIDCVTHRWSAWQVAQGSSVVRQQSKHFTYNYLPADRFYQHASETIGQAGHVLSMDVDVGALRYDRDQAEAETSAGLLRARWIFDSRPHDSGLLKPVLIQRFVGWHVCTADACFDPFTAHLMHFLPSRESGRTVFFYLLPFSTTEALVEATFLDDPCLPQPAAEVFLCAYLDRLPTGGYQVLDAETGAIPMGESKSLQSRRPSGRIVDIGTRGGRVKPSSGYAFLRIQRQSDALAQALAGGRSLPRTFESPVYGALDSIFLRALQRDPERAPTYFMALFNRIQPDILVRFLSETASPGEILKVMLALPKLDFLKAALWRGKTVQA